MSYEALNSAYHDWLVSLVDSPVHDLQRHYNSLMWCLDEIPFDPPHPWDENRISDSRYRRKYFIDSVYYNGNAPIGVVLDREFVSFLEVFVGLFVDLSEKVFVEPGDGSLAPDFFLDFLGEMDFLRFDDGHFDPQIVEKSVELFTKKSKKVNFFGETLDRNLDFWAIFSTIFNKKY